VVDYHGDFGSKVKDVDLVVDGSGADTQAKSYRTLKPGGRLISLVGPPPPAPEGIEAIATRMELTRELLLRVGDLAQTGRLKVTIAKIFPLAEAGEAQEYSHSGDRHGKVLLAA
jgi:NADPH:quinone reductase-like Zn-dependent oxidoreductase